MPRIAVVTDSTCDLTLDVLDRLGVVMVPLKVLFGNESFLDWIEIAPADFYKKLAAAPELPKTSQPSPADFKAAYQRCADAGADGIVSIHLSAALSGTFSSATLAAADSPIPVRVVDSKEVSQGLGLVVKAAAERAAGGADIDEVAARAVEVASKTHIFFVVETMENLVKGGRAGKAQGLAASLLNIKPVLTVNDDGIIEAFKKVKGRKKAIAELAAHVAEEAAQQGRLKLTVLHACNDDDGEELRAELVATGADIDIESTGIVGAVIGTYTGPRVIGCAYHPAG